MAHIHDVLVLPAAVDATEEDPRINILGGEITRALEFGRSALNPAAITDLQRIALQFSRDSTLLLNAGYEDEE